MMTAAATGGDHQNLTPVASSDPTIPLLPPCREADDVEVDPKSQDRQLEPKEIQGKAVSSISTDIGYAMKKQEIREAVENPVLYKQMDIDPSRYMIPPAPRRGSRGAGKRVFSEVIERHTLAAFRKLAGSEFADEEDRSNYMDPAILAKENASSLTFTEQLYVIARSCSDIETRAYRVVKHVFAGSLAKIKESKAASSLRQTIPDCQQEAPIVLKDSVDIYKQIEWLKQEMNNILETREKEKKFNEELQLKFRRLMFQTLKFMKRVEKEQPSV